LDLGILVASIVAVAVLVRVIVPIVPEAFNLQFNPYALISLSGLLLDLTLYNLLIRRTSHSDATIWFALFIGFGMLWSGSEALERMATSPVGAMYWGDIVSGITVFLPTWFYLFVRHYTNRTRVKIHFWIPASIICLSGAMAALLSGNNVFVLPVASERMPWGYVSPSSIVEVVFIAWAALLTLSAIVKLVGFFLSSTSIQDRRQSMIFIVAATMVLVVSALTEVLLPMIGIESIPPLGVLSNALLALSVIIGITRYGSFTVGIDEIAETVLSTMADGVIVTDSNYRVVYSNNKSGELLNGRGDSLLGSDLTVAYGKSLEISRPKWEADLKVQGTANVEDLEIGSTENPVTVNLQVTLLKAAQPGYIFVFNDVSELKRASDDVKKQSVNLEISNKAYQQSQVAMLNLLEDSRELETELKREKAGIEKKITERTIELQTERESLEAIINGVDFGIYMIGPDLHVNMVNKPMQELYSSGMEKKYTLASFDTDVQGFVETQQDIKEALKTQSSVSRTEYPRGNRILRSFRSPLYEPGSKPLKLLGIINVLQDITEAKAAERSRDEFFSIASHELRTPLTAIRGNTSMIQDYFADQLKDPALKEMIGDIHDSSIRLITIVNDFLNTSRLEQGKIDFKIEPVDPADLVHEVIKELQAGDTGAKVPLESNLTAVPDVLADRDRLKEVLINLVGNAVKFTDAGSITVGLALDGKNVKLSVTDTGKGIPLGSQGLLFHKFQQASNNILTRDATRSTGLGLYISKLLMTGMGGEIFLEKSAAGKGATFSVLIPTVKSAVPPKLRKTKTALTGVKS